MRQVAFLIGQGERGTASASRTVGLAQPSPTVRLLPTPESAGTVLDEIAADIPGSSEARVIHLLDAEDASARAALPDAVAAIAGALSAYPALIVSQYVIAFVGREWDEAESSLVLGLDERVAAVLVIARSNEAAVELTMNEEECMASDLAYALITSDLAGKLHTERFWLAGTSAVYYRRRVLLAALTAFHVREFLASTFLRELDPRHTECDEGEAWVQRLELGRGEHLGALDRAPAGGSLWREARLDPDLFADAPPELLLDVLRSFTQQNTDRLLSGAREQIGRNQAQHRDDVEQRLADTVKDLLRRRQNLPRAQRFVQCAAEALAGPLQDLQIALSDTESDDGQAEELDAIEVELGRRIRRLPYPASVAARSLGLGGLGVAGYQALAAMALFDPNFAILGLAGGLVLSIPLLVRYGAQRSAIDRLRRRYLVLSQTVIQAQIKRAVLAEAAAEVELLRRFTEGDPGSLGGRLRALQASMQDLLARHSRRVADRVLDQLTTSKYSAFVPTVDDLDTAGLAARFPLPAGHDLAGTVLDLVLARSDLGELDVDDLDTHLVDAMERAVGPTLWPDLTGVVQQSPASRKTVVGILGTATAPIVLVDKLTTSVDGVQRLVTVDHTRGGGLLDDLAPTSVTGYLSPGDSDAVVQVAVRPVPPSMRSES